MSKILNYNDLKNSNAELKNQILKDVTKQINSSLQNTSTTRPETNKCEHLIEGTYQEIFSLYKNGLLEPGKKYAITNYVCAYKHPSGGNDEVFELMQEAKDVKYIILDAIDVNKFDYEVQYVRKDGYAKIIECHYTIDPQECPFTADMTTYTPTGAVFYMRDEYFNECSYDFKHVKFRRYAINDIVANTDPNDGTGGFAGPYKFAMTDTAYKFSDARTVIGSGDNWDKTFIPALFEGKWGHLLSYTSNMKQYSDEFIKCHIKPYKNEKCVWDKYLSWQTNMRETYGLSAPVNRGSCKAYGQAIVYTDPENYRDRYTFDYNGQDASERMTADGSQPLVRSTSILNGYCGIKYPKKELLPNTVIAISESCINGSNTRIETTNISTESGLAGVRDNTILVKNTPGYEYGYMLNCNFKIGEANYGCRSNLFIIGCMIDCQLNGATNNFLVGTFQYLDICDYIQRNVIFGYYSNLKGYTLLDSCLYGADIRVMYEGETTYKSPSDGSYWYDTVFRDWFGYNIIGPHQYSSFKPHFNTNTVRSSYNKGVDYGPTLQGCSFGRNVWGTNIEYGAVQGGIKMGDLIRCSISPAAFSSISITDSSNQELFNNDQPGVPSMTNVDIRAHLGNPSKISTDLSATQLTRLSDSTRKLLVLKGGKWTLCEADGTLIA